MCRDIPDSSLSRTTLVEGRLSSCMQISVTTRKDRHRESKTIPETTPLVSGVNNMPDPAPAFVRLPKAGVRCPWTGLSRGTLNKLILGPNARVKSVLLSQPGAARGVRIVHFQSLLDYLNGQMEEQAAARPGGKEVVSDV